MKHVFIFTLFFILALCAQSQTYKASNWVFGDSVLLRFTNNIIIDTLVNFSSYEASSSISDSNGNLLYYATPEALYYSNGLKIKKLSGDNSSTQGIFIDMLINRKMLAITTQEIYDKRNCNVNYDCFDLHDTNTSTSRLLLLDGTPQLGILNRNNNNDKWAIVHERLGKYYFSFLISDSNLLCCPVKSSGISYINDNYPTSIVSNLKGNLIASSKWNNGVEIFYFNNENGKLDKHDYLNISFPWSIQFSPNSNYLYFSTTANIYQYDIENNYIFKLNSEIDKNYRQLQNTIDGRILISMKDQKYLGVIEEPNKFGNDCKYIKDGLKLKYGTNTQGLPNFNQSYFYTPSIDFAYKEDCIAHNYSFEGRDTFAAQNHTWQFTKDSKKTIVNGKNINHQFLDTGIWQVQYMASNSQRSDTVVKKLTIEPKWQSNPLGADTFVCPNQNLILCTPPNMHCIHWQGQEPNLDTALGAILDYDHFHQDTFVVTQKGFYSVKLTNKTFCQMWDSVVVSQAPSAEKPQISFATKELASTTKANQYRWFFNDTFLSETQNRSILPTKSGYYQLQIISEFGCQSLKSDSFFIDLSGIENWATFSFEVYPNPNNGLITLQVPQAALYKLFVYDINGKIISTQNITKTQTELNLSHLAKGVYIFKLQNSNEVVASKSVVIR
jgi:hypothetical protein